MCRSGVLWPFGAEMDTSWLAATKSTAMSGMVKRSGATTCLSVKVCMENLKLKYISPKISLLHLLFFSFHHSNFYFYKRKKKKDSLTVHSSFVCSGNKSNCSSQHASNQSKEERRENLKSHFCSPNSYPQAGGPWTESGCAGLSC